MQTKNDLIKYRLARSNESLEEAKLLAKSNHWNTVANRLYYAAYYSIIALFVEKEIKASTHTGVKAAFHKEFIKTGLIEIHFGKLYNNLFNKRQEGDYQDFQYFEEETIRPLIGKVEQFISVTNKLIE